MGYVTEVFTAYTTESITAEDKALPLSQAATADLLSLLIDTNDYTYLSLVNDTGLETVKVTNDYGTLVLARGQGGTSAQSHPTGTCVKAVSPTVVAAIKDLVCNYTCCEDEDCPCNAVAVAGVVAPDGIVGHVWKGAAVFSGDLPIVSTASGLPAWMEAEAQGNMLLLSGTPDTSGEVTFSVAASNCNGTKVATQTVTVTVNE